MGTCEVSAGVREGDEEMQRERGIKRERNGEIEEVESVLGQNQAL